MFKSSPFTSKEDDIGESICETYAFQLRSSRTPSLVGDPTTVLVLPDETTIEFPSVTFPAILTLSPALLLHNKWHENDKLPQ